MKRVNYLFVVLICAGTFCFCGCHNMCGVLEKNLGAVQWDQKLEWVDARDKTSVSESSKFTSQKVDGQYVITGTGSGNWGFTNSLGRSIKGFDAEVKLGSNIQMAGFEIWETTSQSEYVFYIDKNGTFVVRYDSYTNNTKDVICKIPKAVENVHVYNSIRAELMSDRSTRVLLNKKEICRIPDHSMKYGIFTVFVSGGGSAQFKINEIER